MFFSGKEGIVICPIFAFVRPHGDTHSRACTLFPDKACFVRPHSILYNSACFRRKRRSFNLRGVHCKGSAGNSAIFVDCECRIDGVLSGRWGDRSARPSRYSEFPSSSLTMSLCSCPWPCTQCRQSRHVLPRTERPKSRYRVKWRVHQLIPSPVTPHLPWPKTMSLR